MSTADRMNCIKARIQPAILIFFMLLLSFTNFLKINLCQIEVNITLIFFFCNQIHLIYIIYNIFPVYFYQSFRLFLELFLLLKYYSHMEELKLLSDKLNISLSGDQIDQFKTYYEKYFTDCSILIEVNGMEKQKKSIEYLASIGILN